MVNVVFLFLLPSTLPPAPFSSFPLPFPFPTPTLETFVFFLRGKNRTSDIGNDSPTFPPPHTPPPHPNRPRHRPLVRQSLRAQPAETFRAGIMGRCRSSQIRITTVPSKLPFLLKKPPKKGGKETTTSTKNTGFGTTRDG